MTARLHPQISLRLLQLVILVVFLLAWEYLPMIPGLRAKVAFLDPFFISSPSRLARVLVDLAFALNGTPSVWGDVWATVSSSMAGVVLGIFLGASFGLLLSSSRYLSDLLQPFVVALNAVPRIALIPIVVIIFGPTFKASIVIAVMVVFFIAFYNAYEGGRTVTAAVLDNAKLMRASRYQVARFIRLPYAFAWMMTTLPLATTFALLAVVTGEVLTGTKGLGRLITMALGNSNADLTFAVVVILSIVGIAVSAMAGYIRRRALHWWDQQLT